MGLLFFNVNMDFNDNYLDNDFVFRSAILKDNVGLVLRFEYKCLGTRSSAPMYANYTSYANLDCRNQFLPPC